MATNQDDTPDPRIAHAERFDPAEWSRQMGINSHSGFLGMRYRKHGSNWIELELDWREDLVGNVETGVLASGPIISLLDNTTSMAVWTTNGQFRAQVTLDLRIDYLRAAVPRKTVIARAECYKMKRTMAFVRGIAHDGDPSDPVAHVTGIFMLVDRQEWSRTS